MKYALRRLRRRPPMAILVVVELSQVSSPLADIKGRLLAADVETSLRGICRLCLQFAETTGATGVERIISNEQGLGTV